MVEEEKLYRGKGAGSRNSMGDEMVTSEWSSKDKRAGTHTTYYASDVDDLDVSQRRKKDLKRILRLQEGEHQNSSKYKDRSAQNRIEDQRRWIDSFASQLDMAASQKERIKYLVIDVLNLRSYGPYSSEKIILAVINVVAREQGRFIEDEDGFENLMADVEITHDDGKPDKDTMRRLRELTRDRMP